MANPVEFKDTVDFDLSELDDIPAMDDLTEIVKLEISSDYIYTEPDPFGDEYVY